MKNSILLLVFTILIFSCKQDTFVDHTALFSSYPSLVPLNDAYMKFKDDETALNLLNDLGRVVLDKNVPEAQKKALLEAGLDVANQNNLNSRAIAILYPLIRDYGDPDKTSVWTAQLANNFYETNKEAAANVLASSLFASGKSGSEISNLKSKYTLGDKDVNVYIAELGEGIFENPDDMGLNRNASMNYIDACQAYALSNPEDKQSPEYLYKAAEVAKSIRSSSKSLSLYDWILSKYPNNERAPTALFIKGFILENELKNQVSAKSVYEEFLVKYPTHQLADDVQFLVENLGKSDEEIAKIIEGKQKK